jgi:ribosomal protein S21
MSVLVEVKDGKIDDALRRLKKKMESAQIMEIYQKKQYFIKPSLERREKRKARLKYG